MSGFALKIPYWSGRFAIIIDKFFALKNLIILIRNGEIDLNHKCDVCHAGSYVFAEKTRYCFLGFSTNHNEKCPQPKNSAEFYACYAKRPGMQRT